MGTRVLRFPSGMRNAVPRMMLGALLVAACLVLGMLPLAAQYGDAQQGARILDEQRCTSCHAVAGKGGAGAPDLGRRSDASFTPAALAASLWNHGPPMWKAMAEKNMEMPRLSPSDLPDIYAYFFALRYFEPPGDAARGKNVFVSKSCNRCHALVETEAGAIGPPVAKWESLNDPLSFTQNMWNHASAMAAQFEQEGIASPRFTLREMTDLVVYLQNIPGVPSRQVRLRFGQASAGDDVFQRHQCLNCHTFGFPEEGMVDLSAVSRRERSLTGLAVAMWNHRSLMAEAFKKQNIEMKPFENDEMAQLVAYLFEENYFDAPGDAERGRSLFEAKKCGDCHGKADSRAPALRGSGGGYTASTFAAAVWSHGPKMAAEMERQKREWPTLTDRDVVNLTAFLNTQQ